MATFPRAIATNADLLVAQNSSTGVLAVNLDAVGTTVVATSSAFPEYSAVVIDGEIIRLGNLVGGAYLNCIRGYDGSAAAMHSVGAAMTGYIVAKHHNALSAEIKAIEGLLGANASSLQSGAISARTFQFSLAPSVSLAAGVPNTITPDVMVLGITGGSPNAHYLRIVDATAGDEVVMITAATATSFTFTPAVAHSAGSYTIQSASDGIQEAVKWSEAQPNGGGVLLSRGYSYLYGTVYLEGTPGVALFGAGKHATTLVGMFASGDLIFSEQSSMLVGLYDFSIGPSVTHTSGAAIHLKDNTGGKVIVSNVRAVQSFRGFWLDNSDFVTLFNCDGQGWPNPNASDLVYISGGSGDFSIIGGIYMEPEINYATMTDFGIRIVGADGGLVVGAHLRANMGIGIYGEAGSFIGSVLFAECIVDKCRQQDISIGTTGTPAVFSTIQFVNCHVFGWVGMEDEDMVIVDTTSMAGVRSGISFIGCTLANGNKNNARITGVNTLTLVGNHFANGNWGGTGGDGLALVNCSNVAASANTFEDTRSPAQQGYGLVLGGTMDLMALNGNTFKRNLSGPINNLATITNSCAEGNPGINTVRGAITAAASVSVATLCDTYIVSGTTTINTITGALGGGDERYLFCPSGLTFSTAGNIANSITTTTAGQVVAIIWDAVDAKWRIR